MMRNQLISQKSKYRVSNIIFKEDLSNSEKEKILVKVKKFYKSK
jgi:hypothetical protein